MYSAGWSLRLLLSRSLFYAIESTRMFVVRNLALVCVCLMMGACSSALRWTPETHVVQSGETIYSIAFEFGIDQRDLLGWNDLDTNGLIFTGQRLRLTPPDDYTVARSGSSTTRRQTSTASSGRTAPSTPSSAMPVNWRWPTDGSVIAGFGASAKTESGVHRSSMPAAGCPGMDSC